MQGVFAMCAGAETLQAYAVFAQGLDDWELLNVTTAPAYRGQGLASQLLAAGEGSAALAGAQRVLLEVRPSNSVGLAMYRSRGYTHTALRKGYYAAQGGAAREDALIYALAISAPVPALVPNPTSTPTSPSHPSRKTP